MQNKKKIAMVKQGKDFLNKQNKQQKKNKPNSEKQMVFDKKLLYCLLILIVTVIVAYWPVKDNGITNWDDPTYVTENPMMGELNAENIIAIFSTPVSLNYHPLTILSLVINYNSAFDKITGKLNAVVFHRTNVLFHLLNTLLVFLFIWLLLGKKWQPAFFVALLFGVHPMHVESVAWIAERKDVLYVFFYLLSLIAYIKYIKEYKSKFLILSFFVFILSLFSKAVAVTVPIIMLLIDYLLDRKFTLRVWLEKIPFFILSFVFGVMAIRIQSHGAISEFEVFSFYQRIIVTCYGFLFYIVKFFAPINLSTYYPYHSFFIDKTLNMPFGFHLLPILMLSLATIVLYSLRKTRKLFFAFTFYFIALALVLQFLSVGQVIAADRYSYLPYIGLAMLLYFLYEFIAEKYKQVSIVAFFLFAVFSIGLIVKTQSQVKLWKNSGALWTNVINLYPQVEMAYKNRGNYFARELNDLPTAMKDYDVLIKMDSKDAGVWSNLGNIYGLKNEFNKARHAYGKAIAIDSANTEAYMNRAITYAKQKLYDSAFIDFDKALELNPTNISLRETRAYSYLEAGKFTEAIEEYNYFISRRGNNPLYFMNRGIANFNLNKLENARIDFQKVISYQPHNGQALFNLSFTLSKLNIKGEALKFAIKAKEVGYQVNDVYLKSIEN